MRRSPSRSCVCCALCLLCLLRCTSCAAGNAKEVFGAYTALAQHYQNDGDARTGIYFLEKCVEIARLTRDAASEMASNHNLGLAYEQIKDIDTSVRYHERHRQLAKDLGDLVQENIACGQLVSRRAAPPPCLRVSVSLCLCVSVSPCLCVSVSL